MSEPRPTPAPSIQLRLARWVAIAGIIGACASTCLVWMEDTSGNSYVPMCNLLYSAFQWMWSPVAWPFMPLVFYALLGEVGGRRARAVVTWAACIVMGLMVLAEVILWAHVMSMAFGGPGGVDVAGIFTRNPLGAMGQAACLVAGFAFFAVPLARPQRAGLSLSVALSALLILAMDATYLPILGAGNLRSGYWLHLASACIMFLGAIRETILLRRAASEEKKT